MLSISIARSNYIANAASTGEKEFMREDKSDPTVRVLNAVSMARNCALASSIADQKASQAIGNMVSNGASDAER